MALRDSRYKILCRLILELTLSLGRRTACFLSLIEVLVAVHQCSFISSVTQHHLLFHHRTNLILKKNYLFLVGAEVVWLPSPVIQQHLSVNIRTKLDLRKHCLFFGRKEKFVFCCNCQPFSPYIQHHLLVFLILTLFLARTACTLVVRRGLCGCPSVFIPFLHYPTPTIGPLQNQPYF